MLTCGRVPQAVMPLCPPDAAVRAATTHTHTPVDAIRVEISHP